MLESSLKIGQVAGIRIGIHYTWLIIFFLLNSILYYVFQQQLNGWSDTVAIVTALITSIMFFTSIILHELGHSIVAIRNGINVKSITLFIFGGVAQTEHESKSAAVEFKVAIAGPLVSFLLFAVFSVLREWLATEGSPLYAGFDWLATINLIVAIFNLIPGFPLDGGRVFRAIIWALTGDESKGMRWAVNGGRIVAYGLMAMGAISAFQTGNILNGIWMIGIGWFLLSAAEASGRAFTQEHIFQNITIHNLMLKNVPRVKADITIDDWINKIVLPKLQRAALVTSDHSVIGIVSLSDLQKVPKENWHEYTLQHILTPINKMVTVTVDAPINNVLIHMQSHSLNQIPVTHDQEVVGWIDRETILRALRVYNESGKQ